MLVPRRRGWEIPESEATPEAAYLSRRAIIAGGAGLIGGALLGGAGAPAQYADPTFDLYPAKRNERYPLDRDLTPEPVSADYNNFYEFGSSKSVAAAARALRTRPWTVAVDGLVEKPFEIGVDDLIRKMPLEERLYRLRCVEAWAMAVPWTGFPLKALVDLARPLSSARYVRLQTFLNRAVASGQRQTWYPWPYTEGVTIAEASNELAFLVTGAYGKPLVNQFGAPLRLAPAVEIRLQIREIDRAHHLHGGAAEDRSGRRCSRPNTASGPTSTRPCRIRAGARRSERILGTSETRPTVIYNGYGEYVAGLYTGLDKERLYV